MGNGARGGPSPIDRIVASARGYVPTDAERRFYGELVTALAARRRALGITQEGLDKMLGVSEGQLGKWESMARLPGAFMMMCWANSLGVKLVVQREP